MWGESIAIAAHTSRWKRAFSVSRLEVHPGSVITLIATRLSVAISTAS
jgi:hypothetical protein